MAYRIDPAADVAKEARRVSTAQLGAAIDDLHSTIGPDPAAAIHDCRKRCKKIRGLARLVRPALGSSQYDDINRLARDAARELSITRDAEARSETFTAVTERVDLAGDLRRQVSTVAETLAHQATTALADLTADDHRVRAAADHLATLGRVLDELTLHGDGWSAIGPGLAKTYSRGIDALDEVRSSPSADGFHDWRKRVKYTRYHVRLLTPIAPSVLSPLHASLSVLSGRLGDAHDLVVLAQWFRSDDVIGDVVDVDAFVAHLDARRDRLESASIALGERVYAESSDRFADRLGGYWTAWHDVGPEPDD